jgi:hypothetical protein
MGGLRPAGPVQLEEDLLRDIFSFVGIRQQQAAQAQHPLVVRVVEVLVVCLLKRISVHAPNPFIIYSV